MPEAPANAPGPAALRERLRAASAALSRDDGSAAPLVEKLDASPLGLSGLPAWIALMAGIPAKTTSVSALLAYAADEPLVPLSRAALASAARLAASPAEREAVRAALAERPVPERAQMRAFIARSLAEAHAASGEGARARLGALAGAFPDAPALAADLFDDEDREAFDAAVRAAPIDIRLARARVLAPRDSASATALLRSLSGDLPAGLRLDAADVWLRAGSPRDALRLLAPPLSEAPRAADTLHRDALSWLAETRISLLPEAPKRRAARRAAPKKSLPQRSPAPPTAKQKAEASRSIAALDALLARPLTDEDRRRLLEGGIRVAWKAALADDARRLLGPLLALDPATDAGAAERFAEAWGRYSGGDFAGAARLLDELITTYRGASQRRRATYWSARAHERAGDAATAKALYAALVPGTVPDLYGRWAAAALGVTLPAAPPAALGTEAGDEGGPDLPSRELLRCGFPGLAEDAAESEGSLDSYFEGRAASARGDHRRAASLLKRRFPELGTPEEGAVPPEARAAFYPLAQADRIAGAARAAGLPASLLFGLIRQESVFTEDARSRSGALGLMQVMPSTGRQLYKRENGKGRPDLKDPDANLRLGARYLKQLVDAFSGDTAAALAAYNAGPAHVRVWKKASNLAPEDEFLESIPFGETRSYVKRVLFFQCVYASLYGLPLDEAPPVAALPAAEPKP